MSQTNVSVSRTFVTTRGCLLWLGCLAAAAGVSRPK